MRRMGSWTLVCAAIAIGFEATIPKIAKANSANSDTRVAQMFFPPVSDRHAIMVLGQGQVSLPADTARMEFLFSNSIPSESPSSTSQTRSLTLRSKQNSPFESQPQPTVTPLTKESFKPIVDALVASGVPANAIEVIVTPSSSSSFPFPFPGSEGGAKVVMKLDKPTRDRLQQIVTVVNEAARKNGKIVVKSVNVRYAMKDCQDLVRAAYQAAVKDARNRAEAIAQAMNVQLGKVPSVAESFFYDLLVPLCSEATELPSFLQFGSSGSRYDPNAPIEVQLRRDIFVTYPIK